MNYTIVGVIGHIDHGKTSLVAALSGMDTDTHPEEKRRGITIDLGFASFTDGSHRFALIDAPGHQKYIGNLLAGVSAIDVGLLVVACDQGIQNQTLEHASILQMLGVKRLVVALSRIDLASADRQQELREELELFLDDFGFHDVPMIPVSIIDGTGISALKSELIRLGGTIPDRPQGRWFRMPVDRVFTMPGRGCVLAGTVWSGGVRTGSSLALAGSGRPVRVRVREVEVHGQAVDGADAGFRTALNVTGVSAAEVRRGDELIAPGVFPQSRHLLVELATFRDAPEIKCPATLQIHLASTACSGRVTGTRRLSPARSTVVLVETDHPVVATFGQRALLRLPYPVGTLGGATVLAALDRDTRRTRRLIEFGERLAMSDQTERLVAWTDFLGELEPVESWSELQAGIPSDALENIINDAVQSGHILRLSETARLVSPAAVDRIQRRVLQLLTTQAEESQDAWSVEESVIRQVQPLGSPELVRWSVQQLIDERRVVRLGRMVAVASDENTLSKKQQARMEQIVRLFDDNRSPPTLKEIAGHLQVAQETVTSLSRFAVQAGLLLEISDGLLLSAQMFRQLCRELQDLFQAGPERSVAEIRDTWQVTRKHAIPFLEFCDRLQVTHRDDNMRRSGPALPQFAESNDSEV
ncbi:MAG: selenocysteine-specific translation elongation factor [Fuerstiella sp.]